MKSYRVKFLLIFIILTLNIHAKDFAILLDTSASMNGNNKIPYARLSVGIFLNLLDENDRLTLITFNEEANVQYRLTNINRRNRDDIITTLERLTGNYRTNFIKPLELLNTRPGKDSEEQNEMVIIFVTDGNHKQHNYDQLPINDPYIEEKKKECRKEVIDFLNINYKGKNCRIYTIGVGEEKGNEKIDQELLREIANIGGGKFIFAKEPKSLIDTLINICWGEKEYLRCNE